MFTGIIEEQGRILAAEPLEGGRRFRVETTQAASLAEGDSIAVDGVCTTVVALEAGAFHIEAIGTTLSRTTMGEYAPGRRVNLERSLALGDRLGGHLVQGHVDGVGEVVALERRGEHVLLDIRLPELVADVTVLHGSIAINGVSMTVNALPSRDVAQVAIIPYTWEHTNFAELAVGRRVNLEGDMLGKFVVHYLSRRP
jgi:riboflavin synthase